MVNIITYQLEMSFIPNPEIAPTFFLWIADQNGEPISLPYPVLQSLLDENEWTRQFTIETSYPTRMVIIEDDIVFSKAIGRQLLGHQIILGDL